MLSKFSGPHPRSNSVLIDTFSSGSCHKHLYEIEFLFPTPVILSITGDCLLQSVWFVGVDGTQKSTEW